MFAPRWYSNEMVEEGADVARVIDALAVVLARELEELATNVPKTMGTWSPSSSTHSLGAVDQVAGVVAIKSWVNTPVGASAVLTLFDAITGSTIAIMDAGRLGQLRTAAMTALATKALSDPHADELAIIGSGRQALDQVRAIHHVRPLRSIKVWSPRKNSRESFAADIQSQVGVAAIATSSLEAAVADTSIVTLVTRASEPFLRAGMLAPGTHLNAIGAILRVNAEFDPNLLRDASLVVVDSLENAHRGSRELNEYFADDWSAVTTVAETLASGPFTRDPQRLTVFKGMGSGVADLAVAELVTDRLHPESRGAPTT